MSACNLWANLHMCAQRASILNIIPCCHRLCKLTHILITKITKTNLTLLINEFRRIHVSQLILMIIIQIITWEIADEESIQWSIPPQIPFLFQHTYDKQWSLTRISSLTPDSFVILFARVKTRWIQSIAFATLTSLVPHATFWWQQYVCSPHDKSGK